MVEGKAALISFQTPQIMHQAVSGSMRLPYLLSLLIVTRLVSVHGRDLPVLNGDDEQHVGVGVIAPPRLSPVESFVQIAADNSTNVLMGEWEPFTSQSSVPSNAPSPLPSKSASLTHPISFPSGVPSIISLSETPSNVPSISPSKVPTKSPSKALTKRKHSKPNMHKPIKKPPSRPKDKRLNVLIITADQHRYDAIRFIQEHMKVYNGKYKIRTPNLDRLAKEGVWFENAYAQSSSCAPSRATLRSGCSIERHGIQGIKLLQSWNKDPVVKQKVEAIRTYDQVLHAQGYEVESFGKFHVPSRWFDNFSGTKNVISYDSYSLDMKTPVFRGMLLSNDKYLKQVEYWTTHSKNNKQYSRKYRVGMQTNPRSNQLYTPIRLDPRHGLKRQVDKGVTEYSIIGVDSLPAQYSLSAYTGSQGRKAIRRLSQNRREGGKPWCLTISFENPHPPYVVTESYARHYLDNRHKLLVPPNIRSQVDNDYYANKQRLFWSKGFADEQLVRGWTAIYYGMVEQVDAWIGNLLDELDRQGATKNTLVVFTSDHGEFLGAHGLQGKMGLFEEALRVPFFMRLPGKIKQGTVVKRPVAHMDIYATIMDYLGYAKIDKSDGKSLRSAVSGTSYKRFYDDEVAVSEVDLEDGDTNLGIYPNFMVRHGNWKLMVAKYAKSETEDMLFDLGADPFEQNNLLSPGKLKPQIIGKAEHLKSLLLEWMRRNDGSNKQGFYSLPKYNWNQGQGDIREIVKRRSWDAADQWVSDTRLVFNRPVYKDGKWRSHAWLYIGRTTEGTLQVSDITVVGAGQQYFTVSDRRFKLQQNDCIRIRVAFESRNKIQNLKRIDVKLVIRSNVRRRRIVKLVVL